MSGGMEASVTGIFLPFSNFITSDDKRVCLFGDSAIWVSKRKVLSAIENECERSQTRHIP